uniref:Uncharacterized protein n=1 Tax=Octopus bimaculoides TaxID=37653 RepID=A0A0L8HQ50_OCTBM
MVFNVAGNSTAACSSADALSPCSFKEVIISLVFKSHKSSLTCLELYIFLIWVFFLQVLKDNIFC